MEVPRPANLTPPASPVATAATPADAAPAERRRSPRESQHTVATLQPAWGDTSAERQVQVCNLSLGGVGFRAKHRLAPGETYRITLGAGALFLNARLRVVSCRPRPDGTYDIGAAFC